MTYYDKSLSLDRSAGMLDNKALALYKLGNYTGALELLNSALTLDPRDEYAFYNKGLVLIRLGVQTHDFADFRAGLENLDKALAINPSDRDALHVKTLLVQLLQHYHYPIPISKQ